MPKVPSVLVLVALLASSVQAQTNYGAGSTAAPWLKLASSARIAGLADAGSALSNDLDVQALNPASLASLKGQNVALMHNAYVLDSAIEHAAYGMGLFDGAGIGLSADYMSFGSVDKYKVVNNALVSDGSFTPTGLAATLGYGQALGAFSLGINAKYISQNLIGNAASAFGDDLGLQWGMKSGALGLGLAAAYQNLGTTLEGASLPQGAKLGALASEDLGGGVLSAVADFNALAAEGTFGTGSVGLEFMGREIYALRGGYKFMGNGGAGGATVGGGLRYGGFTVDYAFVMRDVLGAANQVSLAGHF